MIQFKRLTGLATAAIVVLGSGIAGAVELGDPNVTITDGTTTLSNNPSFTAALDVKTNAANAGTSPTRVLIGSSASQFFIQAWGSGRTDNLKNSGSLTATGERLLIGGGANTSLMFYSNNAFTTGPGHMFIQGTGANVGFVGIGNSAPTTKLDVSGEVKMTVANITGGSDLAEKFEVKSVGDAKVEPGMVVCIDPAKPGRLAVSTKAFDKTVAGIISGAGGLNTGMLMGQHNSVADGAHPVALSGRVYCMVDTSKDGIEPGDMLTTSDIPGHAMKVANHEMALGAVIGKAMTPLAKGEKGLVMVLVSLQ